MLAFLLPIIVLRPVRSSAAYRYIWRVEGCEGGLGRMSRRRRPRTFREDPWVMWPCCVLPMIFFLVVSVLISTALITYFLGGGLGEGMVYGLVVLGGIVSLIYAVAKRYS
jgi:hypothetical protein